MFIHILLRGSQLIQLLNHTWVHLPKGSKASLLTPGCGKGKCSVYSGVPSKKSRAADAQETQTPQRLLRKDFQRPGEGEGCDQCMDILLTGWW